MFPSGTVLRGQWSGEAFKVDRLLGEGANGAVYLVYTARGMAALKVCAGSAEVALEWSALEGLRSLRGFPAPMLIDDCEWRGKRHSFYVMEWIPGDPFDVAYRKASPIGSQLVAAWLEALAPLHDMGKAFCDLKCQNVLVTYSDRAAVRFVDVGGVTDFGRSVRQFTPTVDRAFWGLGTRTADAHYDLTAVVLTLFQMEVNLPSDLYQYTPEDRRRWLHKHLRDFPGGACAKAIEAALTGRITDARLFLRTWQQALAEPSQRRAHKASSGSRPTARHAKTGHAKAHKRDWSEWLMWCSLSLAVVMTGAAWAAAAGWIFTK